MVESDFQSEKAGSEEKKGIMNLSSVSAFFLTSAEKRTGVACLGSESWFCFFSLNQASASTHSFKTCRIF